MKKIIALVCFLSITSSALAFSIAVPSILPQQKVIVSPLLNKKQVRPVHKQHRQRNIRMSFDTCC